MKRLLLLLAITIYVCEGVVTRPQCSFMVDDPVYSARCEVDVTIPNCVIQCEVPQHNVTCKRLHCWVEPVIPIDEQSADEHCPATQVLCDPLSCRAPGAVCSPLCEAPQAFWHCYKSKGPAPHAIEMCERPACDSSDATITVVPIRLAKIGAATSLCCPTMLIIAVTVFLGLASLLF